MKQQIQLSDHFGYGRLVRFTIPSILMMVITSVYGVVDGYFISNYVGKTPFAAVNFIIPFLMIVGSLGFMFGAGGSALIAKTLGEGDKEKANSIFSLITFLTVFSGIVIGFVSIIFLRPIASFLGAEGHMLEDAVTYGRIILIALPFLMIQYAFSSLVVTAEKPKLGLIVTIISGVLNFIGDYLFMAVFQLGVVGAALATALGQVVGGIVPLVYFGCKNSSCLHFVKLKWDTITVFKTCTNGSSELMNNLSMSLIGMLYNAQLLKYAGENGVAAYGTIMYVNFIFTSVFFGYAVGVAPVISYHYGAKHNRELRSLMKKSMNIIGLSSVVMFLAGEFLATPLSQIYVGYDAELLDMTIRAFKLYAFSFLFTGIAVFGSAFFTALNDGLTSAVISFMRTMVFQVAAVLILPLIWGLDGIWLSVIAAEFMAVVINFVFIVLKRKRHGYH